MSVTPRPWRRSPNANDAIIGERNSRAMTDTENKYYGGPVIGESIRSDDLDFILRAVLLYDSITAGHAVACRIREGAPCDRLPGCLQDGR